MQVWPKLLERAKEGGLNTIETYIFWNAHEPEPGKVKDIYSDGRVGNQPQQN
jgi:hypothetical protein